MKKRDFIKSAAVIASAAVVSPLVSATGSRTNPAMREESIPDRVTLKKGLGYGMINEELSLTDKFKLAKDLGFEGIKLNTPTEFAIIEVLEAKEASGIELPSVVNKDHWSSPLSDPDPTVRKKCIDSVARSLQQVKEMGGEICLSTAGMVGMATNFLILLSTVFLLGSCSNREKKSTAGTNLFL